MITECKKMSNVTQSSTYLFIYSQEGTTKLSGENIKAQYTAEFLLMVENPVFQNVYASFFPITN